MHFEALAFVCKYVKTLGGLVKHADARFALGSEQSDRCQQVIQLLGPTWFVAGDRTKQ